MNTRGLHKIIFVYGTASSGKSNIAENIAVGYSKVADAELIYLATMENKTDAAKYRIKRHKALRKGKGFTTVEEPLNLLKCAEKVRSKIVLLECMSNLCSNVLYDETGDNVPDESCIMKVSDMIVSQVKEISANARTLVIVTNNIFEDGITYDDWTEGYLRLLASVNCELAKMSDIVYEVINGMPMVIKGERDEFA